MIKQLHIHGYKCFVDQMIPFAPLTVLTGANASGKSTVIQSLLLLRQSNAQGELEIGLLKLNGPLVKVGTALDIFSQDAVDQSITFTVTDKEESFQSIFVYNDAESKSYVLNGPKYDGPSRSDCNLWKPTFNYLNAERIGPRLLYPIPTDERWKHNVGIQGEFAPYVLGRAARDRESIANGAAAVDPSTGEIMSQLLHEQTRLWMRKIVQDFEFEATLLEDADQVKILFGNRGLAGSLVRPTNIGFGLIYTLPIIVAALVAPPGSLLIIENPEAHLHPASQSAMGMFLAQVVSAGVQVVIETHSDHVLNGIRRAVRDTTVSADEVVINYFRVPEGEGVQQVVQPKMYPSGGIRPWPQGFFDQAERDLRKLI